MKKILFIGLVVITVLISGCFQPKVNLNTTIQQQGGATPAAPLETLTPTPIPTPIPILTATPSVVIITSTATLTPTSTPTPTISPVATSTVATTVVVAVIQNSEFNPVTITISKGQTVTWTNKDSVPHTVTSTTGDFDSGPISNGQTFSHTFDKAGTFEYSCTIHPSIPHGKVIVTE